MKDTFIFDLDGTLVDSSLGFIIAFNALLVKNGQMPVDDDSIRETISSGARSTIRMAWSEEPDIHQVEDYRTEFLDIYESRADLCQPPAAFVYDGLMDMLIGLKSANCKIGIVTNKASQLTLPILKHCNLDGLIDQIICPEDCPAIKPDPSGVLLAISRLNSQPKNCIYVGDHIKDIHTANAAGIASIAVNYGFKPANENFKLWPANYHVETPSQLANTIYKLSNKEIA